MSRLKQSKAKVLPAPIKGWNARDSLVTMAEEYAVQLDNYYPSATSVMLRKGESAWADGFESPVKTLVSHIGTTAGILFAATDDGIFDISAAGTIGTEEIALTEGYCSWVNFNTSGGDYTLLVNGTDTMKLFDGSTWVSITGITTPAVTGVTTSDLSFVTIFKRRVWFIEKSSTSLWYLPVNQLGGAATEYPVGQLLKHGGYLVAAASWSIDGGEGIDDYFAIASSEGEILIYKGTDPASVNTWALVGIYYLGEPLNQRCFLAYGGDLLYMCRAGVFPLSKVLVNAPTLNPLSLVDVIQPAFNYAATYQSDYEGWEMCIYPKTSALLLNVPIVAETRWDQYVQNMTTGAWARFLGWNGRTIVHHQGELYLGKADTVTKIWSGDSDLGGSSIVGTAVQAFSHLGSFGSNKHVKMLQPHIQTTGSFQIAIATAVDYQLGDDSDFYLEPITVGLGAVWDTGQWDSATFGAEYVNFQQWYTPNYTHGKAVAIKLRLSANVAELGWSATAMIYEPGGVV